MPSLLAKVVDDFVEETSRAILSCDFFVEPAAEIADVALAADEQYGHLQWAALDGDKAYDAPFLLGHCLSGLLFRILTGEGRIEVRVLLLDCVLQRLPLGNCGVGILRGQFVEVAGDVG